VLPVRPETDLVYGLGRTAVHVDPVGRYVYTDADEELHYDGLVIATGSRPALPADWPVDEPGFHVLYGLSGAWNLRQELRTATRVAIIGGGLSGCETACTIRALARDCVIIDSNPGVMRRAIGAFASSTSPRPCATTESSCAWAAACSRCNGVDGAGPWRSATAARWSPTSSWRRWAIVRTWTGCARAAAST
jgi:thioredoxin reductase